MKRLITAEVVRQEAQAGKKCLEVCLPQCIVTPEARLVAEQIGLKLVETIGAPVSAAVAPACPVPPVSQPAAAAPEDDDLAKIRAAVMAQLPAGTVSEDIIDQLVRKVAAQPQAAATVAAEPEAGFQSQTTSTGIKCVTGSTVKMGIFDGAGKENQVGIADVVTVADGSSMAAGFMAWENCFFPWTLTYDEVDLVMEGELHIRCNGETVVGKAGDVIFIPKNSSIEFGTPSKVKFLYVAYPANWQEC